MENLFLEELQEKIRLNSFGSKSHRMALNNNQLILNNTKINLTEITHIKFGAKIMQFGMFPVGRNYYLSLKTPVQELSLVLRSFLGIRDNYLANLHDKLVNGIWLRIGERLMQKVLASVKAGNSYRVGSCRINKEGIVLEQDSAFDNNKTSLIPWTDLSYDKKYDRLVLNSKTNYRLWINLYYIEHWNVDVLVDLLDWIFEEKGLTELNRDALTG